MIRSRETAISDVFGIGPGSLFNLFGDIVIALDETGRALKHPEHILRDQDLAIALGRGADPDNRNINRLRKGNGNRFQHAFHDHCKSAGIGNGLGIREDFFMLFLAAATGSITTQRVHRLRSQTDMRHDRNAALREECDGFRHRIATFQLDRRTSGFGHDPAGRFKRLLGRLFVAAERHVDDDQAVIAPAHHRRTMIAHHVQRYRQGRRQAVNDLAKRISDKQHVAMGIEQLRRACGIGGQHDQRFFGFALEFAALNNRNGQALARLRGRIGPTG